MSDQQLQDEQDIADMHYSESAPLLSEAWIHWKDIIRPATIFQILQAESSPFFKDTSLVIEGRGFGAVTVVAHVVRAEAQAGSIFYLLEDGTGRIRAWKDLSSLLHLHGLNPEAEREERAQNLALEHTYVEVIAIPQQDLKYGAQLKIKSICPIHDYHHVMYHILNVIHCNMLIQQQNIQPYSSDMVYMDFESNEDLAEDLGSDMLVDDGQAMLSHAILPNAFSPQRQQPYAALEPLQRAIVTQMCHSRNNHVSIAELAQAIQASCRCTQFQFNLALQALLEEAYLTSPLDDGHVVLTPRY